MCSLLRDMRAASETGVLLSKSRAVITSLIDDVLRMCSDGECSLDKLNKVDERLREAVKTPICLRGVYNSKEEQEAGEAEARANEQRSQHTRPPPEAHYARQVVTEQSESQTRPQPVVDDVNDADDELAELLRDLLAAKQRLDGDASSTTTR